MAERVRKSGQTKACEMQLISVLWNWVGRSEEIEWEKAQCLWWAAFAYGKRLRAHGLTVNITGIDYRSREPGTCDRQIGPASNNYFTLLQRHGQSPVVHRTIRNK